MGVFLISGWVRSSQEKNIQNACFNLLGTRTFIIQPCQKLKEYSSYNSYRVVVLGAINKKNNISPAHCQAKWKDYSRASLCLFDNYSLKATLKASSANLFSSYRYILYSRKIDKPFLLHPNLSLRKVAAKASFFLARRLDQNLSPLAASFIKAVFLGKKGTSYNNLRHIFVKAGTAHILAISGLHVGIVAGVVLFILKIIRISYVRRIMIAVPLILFYAFICSLRPPVLRAALFYCYFAFSFYLRRRPSLFCALAFAGLIDLMVQPEDIFSISFQLSFLGVFFIIVGFEYFYFLPQGGGMWLGAIKKLFFLSLFVNLGIWPLLSFYFGKVYLLNILVNIVDIPFLGIIIIAAVVYFSFSVGILAKIFAGSLESLVGIFVKLNIFFSHLPAASFDFRISLFWLAVYYFALCFVIFMRANYLIDLRRA
jgi:competence protein ComEC